MARLLFPQSTFAPIVGLELPAIQNLNFATFLGDGTINSKDGTNIAPGGAAFTNIGTGPTRSLNYVTVQAASQALQTSMPDSGDQSTIVWVARAPASGKFGLSMQFGGATSTYHLYVSGAPVCRCGSGPLVTGAGNCDITMTPTGWNLLAWVIKSGKPTAGYNFTTGQTFFSPTNMVLAGRPAAGTWSIGASVLGGYLDPTDVAFALGALTEMNATDLNTLVNALRYPLRDREIYV